MLLLRKIVFYILSAIYIVLCPLIILYAFGYIFTPDTERNITKTGVVYVATSPPGATVYVNKEIFPNKTSVA